MKYGSICSGIEAATVAWESLGWKPSFFSEIDKFPRAVLAHHYPTVPLHGDFTTIQADQYDPIELLVGGTPCQSFSVAGLRKGLADDRGNLALEYLLLARRLRPRWVVWENVPGVLSSNSHDASDPRLPPDDLEEGAEWVGEDEYDADENHAFACFLAGLSELGYGFAYRSFDAQYFDLAQRRERVFVVGYLGDWRRAAAVLFERESLSGHPAPRRKAGQNFAHDVAPSLTGSGRGVERSGESRGQDPVIAIPILEAGARAGLSTTDLRASIGIGAPGDPVFTLQAGKQHAVGFSCKDHGADAVDQLAPTMRAMGHADSHANAGGQLAVVAFQESQSGFRMDDVHATLDSNNGSRRHNGVLAFGGNNTSGPIDVSTAINAHGVPHGRQDFESETFVCATGDVSHALTAEGFDASEDGTGRGNRIAASAFLVRRLTPKECARLQGFPDHYLDIEYRGKPAADGPKYKALGNSMAVPVMAWIGRRIQAVEEETGG